MVHQLVRTRRSSPRNKDINHRSLKLVMVPTDQDTVAPTLAMVRLLSRLV
jgi:hypothetical protein